MSIFGDIASFLGKNGGKILGMAGSVLTGGVPAGVAAVTTMIAEATGSSDMNKAFVALQNDPKTLERLKALAHADVVNLRAHHQEMERLRLEDQQKAHAEQQATIRAGDTASDEYVRKTRPMIARQSWWATIIYIIGFELGKAFGYGDGAVMELALTLIAPAGAYLGFRTADKIFKFTKKGEG